MSKKVQIIKKASCHIVAEYPIIPEYPVILELGEIDHNEYLQDAWENAMDEG